MWFAINKFSFMFLVSLKIICFEVSSVGDSEDNIQLLIQIELSLLEMGTHDSEEHECMSIGGGRTTFNTNKGRSFYHFIECSLWGVAGIYPGSHKSQSFTDCFKQVYRVYITKNVSYCS